MSAPVEILNKEKRVEQNSNQKTDSGLHDSDLVIDLSQSQVIFFDGVCGMCNHMVDFVLQQDRYQTFLFSALQGEIAKQHLSTSDTEDLNSIVLLKKGKCYRHTAAVVRILWGLPLFWKMAGAALWLIPAPLRNVGYRFVAKIRYRLYGKKTSCRLPTPEERSRFLH